MMAPFLFSVVRRPGRRLASPLAALFSPLFAPLFAPLFLLLCLLLSGQARADTCTVTATDLTFPSVSSISTGDAYAQQTFTVVCTWDVLPLYSSVNVCLSLGAGSNSGTSVTPLRTLGNGAKRVNYNLYSDATYTPAKIWGGWGGTSTPPAITFSMTKIVGQGSLTQVVTVYGKLSTDSTLAALDLGPDNLLFTSDFGAASAQMQYNFVLAGLLGCATGPTVPVAFQVKANIINDCTIGVGNMAFPNANLLSGALRSQSILSMTCSKSTAYRVSFSSGTNGASMTARQMKNTSTPELVTYQLSNTLDGASLGDGTGGTTTISDTGNGALQSRTIYGLVPSQSTPSPGDYKDTVTATVAF